MEFNIVDGEQIDYEEIKQAYLEGVRGRKLREMFGIGTSQYTRILVRFREDGIIVPQKGNVVVNNEPKYYQRNMCNGICYWVVSRTVNWKRHYFGRYKTEAEAQARVKELKENNWEGVFDD